MELPIQLNFFRKLELYQEYKSAEYKSARTGRKVWNIEKQILAWTFDNHHHLESPLTSKYIKENILITKNENILNELDPALGNLRVKKYAKEVEGGIEIAKDGLMLGEVINEINAGGLTIYKYPLFTFLVWLTVLAGVFTVVYEAIVRIF